MDDLSEMKAHHQELPFSSWLELAVALYVNLQCSPAGYAPADRRWSASREMTR